MKTVFVIEMVKVNGREKGNKDLSLISWIFLLSLHAYSMEFYGNTQKEEVVSHEMLYFLYIQKVTLHQTELPKRNYIKMILLKKPIFFLKNSSTKLISRIRISRP